MAITPSPVWRPLERASGSDGLLVLDRASVDLGLESAVGQLGQIDDDGA